MPKTLIEQFHIALDIAIQWHKTHLDKLGLPYILHPMAVCSLCRNLKQKIVALLHDVIEDTPCSLENLRLAGLQEDIVLAVAAMTHERGEKLDDYLRRVKGNPLALAVKYKDIEHNMDKQRVLQLPEKDRERLKKRYDYCLAYLDRLDDLY